MNSQQRANFLFGLALIYALVIGCLTAMLGGVLFGLFCGGITLIGMLVIGGMCSIQPPGRD